MCIKFVDNCCWCRKEPDRPVNETIKMNIFVHWLTVDVCGHIIHLTIQRSAVQAWAAEVDRNYLQIPAHSYESSSPHKPSIVLRRRCTHATIFIAFFLIIIKISNWVSWKVKLSSKLIARMCGWPRVSVRMLYIHDAAHHRYGICTNTAATRNPCECGHVVQFGWSECCRCLHWQLCVLVHKLMSKDASRPRRRWRSLYTDAKAGDDDPTGNIYRFCDQFCLFLSSTLSIRFHCVCVCIFFVLFMNYHSATNARVCALMYDVNIVVCCYYHIFIILESANKQNWREKKKCLNCCENRTEYRKKEPANKKSLRN